MLYEIVYLSKPCTCINHELDICLCDVRALVLKSLFGLLLLNLLIKVNLLMTSKPTNFKLWNAIKTTDVITPAAKQVS